MICCNGDCNQGRDCPLRRKRAELETQGPWPFPLGAPPPQDRGYKPVPFNPNNHEDAPL